MRAPIFAVVAMLISATPVFAGGMPVGAFNCQRLMAASYNNVGPDGLMPSVLGSFTVDAKGGYIHPTGKGMIAVSKDIVRFMDGPMKGVIAVPRKDAKGHLYLHVDKEIIELPKAEPRQFDVVCIKS